MRRLLDSGNQELRKVLEKLIADDVDITIREVARRHPALKNASAFTRNPERLALISQARQRQIDARHVKIDPERRHTKSLSEMLEERDRQVAVLEARVKALIASHAACVRAVMLHGGMHALERFWVEYKSVADTLRELDAMPVAADVIELPIPGGKLYSPKVPG